MLAVRVIIGVAVLLMPCLAQVPSTIRVASTVAVSVNAGPADPEVAENSDSPSGGTGAADAAADAGPEAPLEPITPTTPASTATAPAIIPTNVNWLYAGFVPREIPLESLDGSQRWELYFHQTFTTPGLYGETAVLALHDQFDRDNVTTGWGSSMGGFAKRLGTREAEAVVQNSITALGDGLLGWEARYDRCRCDGFWHRMGHAVARDFVTYDQTEKSLRPQVMPYLGAFAGAALASTWEPGNPNWRIQGYQAAVLQVAAGLGVDLIGEFGADIGRLFHRKRIVASRSSQGN